MLVTALTELEAVLGDVDPALTYPPEAMRVPRGKTSGTQKVSLPDGYLEALDDDTPPGILAEAADSGG
jgi:hypothetical protein